MSPALTTSLRRKTTSTSPSACAAGAAINCTGSPLTNRSFWSTKKVSVGQPAAPSGDSAVSRFSTPSCAQMGAPPVE